MTTPPQKQNLPHEVCTTTAKNPNWANNAPTSMEAPVNVVQRWQGATADAAGAAESLLARTAAPRISPLVGPQRENRIDGNFRAHIQDKLNFRRRYRARRVQCRRAQFIYKVLRQSGNPSFHFPLIDFSD